MTKRRKISFFIISAPSGAGKTTLIDMLLKDFPQLMFSISHTTREAREGETDGIEYFFLDKDQFEKMIHDGQFLEWARVHEHYYGTSRQMLEIAEQKGRDLLLDIDVQGAAQVKKQVPEATGIFILPPSYEALRERLVQRKKDSLKQIDHRMETARQEIRRYKEYEYVIINDDLAHAYESLSAIIRSEATRTEKLQERISSIMKSFNIND